MTGISSTLNIAQGAIAAQQYGLNVTGHNIANVNNPDYSRQDAAHKSNGSSLYSGFLFGRGVGVEQIMQRVDQLLENRLTDEKSTQAAFEEAEAYMQIMEGFFEESSETSISSMLTQYWNSWHDLSDNPQGASERVAVYEKGQNFVSRLNAANTDLTNVETDVNREIESAVGRINALTSQIAEMNKEISSLENHRTANDQRDQRNALVDELGTMIDIDTFEQPNGGIIVNVANGFTLVNQVDNYELSVAENEVMWQGSYGSDIDITDKISGGKLGGWLQIRDEIIPKYKNDLDVLAHEMIWAINYQHSQGAGLDYYTGSLTGDYRADESGLLSSYDFGDKIDYAKDFRMWVKDMTTSSAEYRTVDMDMGISGATISDWQGRAPGGVQGRYKLTVVDDATLGDRQVAETDGDELATVKGSGIDVADALNGSLVDQTLTISGGPNGTEKIEIKDMGGDAKRSAASIAEALNKAGGVTAHASENSAGFDITGIANAEDGDEVQFSLYVDGVIQKQSFIVDLSAGTLDEQFEEALLSATEAVNDINSDQDLFVNGLEITSQSGRTLGVQDFEIQDNSGIRLDNFTNFNPGDQVSFTVESNGTPGTSTPITVDLTGVDTTDQMAVAQVFYSALDAGLDGQPFSLENDPATSSVTLRTTDGSDLTLKNAGNDSGDDATIAITALGGTTPDGANANNVLDFTAAANDTAIFNADTNSTDSINFSGNGSSVTLTEPGAAGDKAGVVAGTVTILTDPGMSIQTSVFGASSGGLFDQADAKIGSSIITLGGDGGFGNFTVGEDVTFEVDGIPVTYTVAVPVAPDDNELGYAKGLETALGGALPGADYEVVRTGKSVSIIKNKALEEPIEITDFKESATGDATLRVSTGTGSGASDPENDLLNAANVFRDFSTSTLYSDKGIIKWEKLDADGLSTGEEGLVEVEDQGLVTIEENGVASLSFNVSAGSLVAGNTLTVNTDENGFPDPLNFRVKGAANSKNEMYHFSVKSGGKVGTLPGYGEEPLVIEWNNGVTSGSFEIEGSDPPITPDSPVEVEVDGMKLKFYDGTLFNDDVFTITTDHLGVPVSDNSSGQPTGELLSDWHWTQDSFADRFNTQAEGMKAIVTTDNRLKFEASDDYNAMVNVRYSGENGFSEDNTTIEVKDWTSFDFSADEITFDRNASGQWNLLNDPTGGNAVVIPEGGDDDGFGVDFSGDGLADIEIRFNKKVTGAGQVKFDFDERDADDMGFAFSNDPASSSSGLVAAAGINTFFKGNDALTIEMNEKLSDTDYIAAGRINSETGEISNGDNSNALSLADVQFKTLTMQQWTYNRGSEATSSLTSATLDGYYNTMVGSLGIRSRSIKSGKAFSDIMVNNLKEQRDSISAVSLDEEMIKLMKYQHAFSAASKLVTVSDEMLNTLLGMR
ncbi:MAG: flagellar hook-associated protein FlgK [Desulfobacteraceae bacterium]|nr:flagellar hook-associated protein FlgK [Desulfobacteraceae bacterium]